MPNYIKRFFSIPRNFEEQKSSESFAYSFVSIAYMFTSLFIFFVIFSKWRFSKDSSEKVLLYILLAIAIGFGITSFMSYRYSRIVKKSSNMSEIKKIKLSSYYAFGLIVGIPYMSMGVWDFLNRNYVDVAVLVGIYLSAALVIYFYDWKQFLKNSISFDVK